MRHGAKIKFVQKVAPKPGKSLGQYEFKLDDIWLWFEKQLHRIAKTAVATEKQAIDAIARPAPEDDDYLGLAPVEQAPETFTIHKASDCVTFVANALAGGKPRRFTFGNRTSKKEAVSVSHKKGIDDKITGEGHLHPQLIIHAGSTKYTELVEALPSKKRKKGDFEAIDGAEVEKWAAKRVNKRIKRGEVGTEEVKKEREALDRIASIWCIAEAYRNPSNVAYLLITLYFIKKGTITWTESISSREQLHYPPSQPDASKKLLDLSRGIRERIKSKTPSTEPIPPELYTFSQPYRTSLKQFLITASKGLATKTAKTASDYGSLPQDFAFSSKTIGESSDGHLLVRAESADAARNAIASILYQKILRHLLASPDDDLMKL